MEECYYRSEILHTDLFGKKDNFWENVADIFAPVTFALMMIVTFSNGVLLLRLSKTSQTKYNETKTWRKLEVLLSRGDIEKKKDYPHPTTRKLFCLVVT